MGNTIKKMFSSGQEQQPQQQQQQEQQQQEQEHQQQQQQQEQQPQQPQQEQQQQSNRPNQNFRIRHTMPQIKNLSNIKPAGIFKKGVPIVKLNKSLNNNDSKQNINNNKNCAVHSNFVFHFIRHADSCSAEYQRQATGYFKTFKKLINKQKSGFEIEPFISDQGIQDCTKSKTKYDELFKNFKISNYFCSCLQRTWDTAFLLFGEENIKKFMVAPYLREDTTSPSNFPVSYNENVYRFNFFKEYVKKLNNPSNQQSNKNRQNSNNCPRYSGDGSVLYPPIYYESDLDKFILWYIENFKLLNRCNNKTNKTNKDIHVVVVCHSHIIQEFVKKRMSFQKFKDDDKIKDIVEIRDFESYFKKYFNYCIDVEIDYNVSQNTKPEVVNKYNENYNKSFALYEGSKNSNSLQTNNKTKNITSQQLMKNIVPRCGFGHICVRKISIGFLGNKETDKLTRSPICRYRSENRSNSKSILENVKKAPQAQQNLQQAQQNPQQAQQAP